MTTSKMTKQFAGVDLMKYIMAYAVVAIHFRSNINHDWAYPSIITWFIGLAVPFFFITSGYLLQRKFNDESPCTCSKIARHRAFQVLKIWFCWIIISFPMALYSYIGTDSTIFDLIKSFIKNFLVYGWEPHAAPLWFLYSMFWVCLIISVAVRFRYYKPVLLSFFCTVLLLNWTASICDSTTLNTIKMLTQNTIGGGAYMLAGMMLQSIKTTRNWGGVQHLALLLSFVVCLIKAPYWELISGMGLFILSLTIPIKPGKFSLNLRRKSMWSYYTHETVLFLFFSILHITNYVSSPYVILAMVYVAVFVWSEIMFRLQNTRSFRWLSFLIN